MATWRALLLPCTLLILDWWKVASGFDHRTATGFTHTWFLRNQRNGTPNGLPWLFHQWCRTIYVLPFAIILTWRKKLVKRPPPCWQPKIKSDVFLSKLIWKVPSGTNQLWNTSISAVALTRSVNLPFKPGSFYQMIVDPMVIAAPGLTQQDAMVFETMFIEPCFGNGAMLFGAGWEKKSDDVPLIIPFIDDFRASG